MPRLAHESLRGVPQPNRPHAEHDGEAEAPAPTARPPDSIRHLLELARKHLGMELAFAGQLAAGDEVFRVVVADDSKVFLRENGRLPLTESYCQRMTEGRLSCYVPDARSDPGVKDLEVTRTANIGAYIGVPIVFSDGRLYGAFCCLSSHAEPFLTERDAQF